MSARDEGGAYARIRENLSELGLDAMAAGLPHWMSAVAAGEADFASAMLAMTSEEAEAKRRRGTDRKVRAAGFPFVKTLADFDFSFQPSIPRAVVDDLATLRFLDAAENVVLVGSPGVGKTHIAVALGVEAVRARKEVRFTDCAALVRDLKDASSRGILAKRLKYYAHATLLIIDELGYLDVDEEGADLLFQLVSARYEHRSTVILTPDSGLAAEREAAEAAKLQRIYDALSDEDHKEIVACTEALRASQQAPDSPEALAAIPSLTLADLPRENVILPKEEGKAGDLAILAHDIDTSGILYAEILFPLDAVPTELLPLVPLMGRSLTEMGTSRRDFVELGTLLASKTGGMDAAPLVATMRGTRMPVAKLCLGGKATADKADDLFSLMAEVLTDTNFDNPQRFTQMVLEERARLEQSLIPAGHGTVIARLRAAYSLAGQISEAIGGITYLEAIRALSERVVSDWDSVRADLEILRGLILNRQDAILNLTADAGTLAAVQPYAAALGRALPTAFSVPLEREPLRAATNEALIVPAQVNYVGKGCNIYDLGYTWHGSAHVITRHLRMGWLWDQVRVQGGAYGAFCALDRMSGSLALVSYRDPNVEKTLATYDATADYLRKLDLSDRDLTLAIVGAIGDLDTYLLPDARGAASLSRHLTDDRDDLRQQMREEILGTTRRHFTEFADVMAEAAKAGTVCVLGGSAAENAATEHGWTKKKVL